MDQSTHNLATRSESTRRQLMRGLAGSAIGAGLLGTSRVGASGQEATPQPGPAPRLEWICTVTAQLGEPLMVGETPHGTRVVFPVADGIVAGPQLAGRLIAPTADWMIVRPDGVAQLDARATMRMEDGALIYATNRGYVTNVPQWLPRWSRGEEVAPEEYDFGVTPWFETSAPAWDWLQRTTVVGTGRLVPGGLVQEWFRVG